MLTEFGQKFGTCAALASNIKELVLQKRLSSKIVSNLAILNLRNFLPLYSTHTPQAAMARLARVKSKRLAVKSKHGQYVNLSLHYLHF